MSTSGEMLRDDHLRWRWMMAFKKFTSKDKALGEPVGFEWNGERFQCKQQVSANKMIRFMREGTSGGSGSVDAMLTFVESVLMVNDVERFRALLDDDEMGIDFDSLTEIIGFLTEVYSGGVPTGESSSTTSSSPSTGDVSMGGSSHAGSTPSYSRQTAV